MDAVMKFDKAAAGRIAATYTTPDVVEQRRLVLARLALAAGESVLDIGSGPGLLAAEMAVAVGPSGSVHGVDPSDDMLAIARGHDAPGLSAPILYRAGDACALPFPDGTFDAAVSTQVYEYVADVPRALAEANRVLKPGGRLLVLDTDWDSIVWRSRDPERMRRLLGAWDEHLADPHLPRRLTGLLDAAGFTVTERAVIPMLNAGYDPNTYSAGLIGFVTAFVPGHGGFTEADVRAWAEDLTALGDEYFFSLNRYVFVAVK